MPTHFAPLLRGILTYMDHSPHTPEPLKAQTAHMLHDEIGDLLNSVLNRADIPLPPGTNMGGVVNQLTTNSTSLTDLYSVTESIIIQGAASPHFLTTCTILSQLWGGGVFEGIE